jgi:hypothetical protein
MMAGSVCHSTLDLVSIGAQGLSPAEGTVPVPALVGW